MKARSATACLACLVVFGCDGATVTEPDGGPMIDGAVPPADADAGDSAGDLDGAPGVGGVDAGPLCALTEARQTATSAGLEVVHRDGQTFITWPDRAEGAAGAAFQYRLYRSTAPITSDADLASAELVAAQIANNSGQLFGEGFRPENRIDPARPMSITTEGGEPLPLWTGLAVATAEHNGCAFYAVVATDLEDSAVETVETDVNATTVPVAEVVAPRVPVEVLNSDERDGPYIAQTRVTDTPNMPLMVVLHASNAGGGGAGDYGDYYTYFGDSSMGYQDGLPGVFSVEETHSGPLHLMMRNRDTIVEPTRIRGFETLWFGYVSETRDSTERLARPFTESRLDWMIPWVITRYRADPRRVYVEGGSMGAWGSMTYASRRPELFAAVYPNRPRMVQDEMRTLSPGTTDGVRMPNGELWAEHHDSIRFVHSHPEDLPFVGWNCGRNDGFATWQEQVDMVRAMTEERHGFAFAWNDGDHSTGVHSAEPIKQWYAPALFALDESYPAFANSSIDDDLGSGDPDDGDLEGGINLGFVWTVDADEEDRWVLTLSNELASAPMTVDVTPRRLQRFLPASGSDVDFTTSRGGAGSVGVDDARRLTVVGVEVVPGEATVITITR